MSIELKRESKYELSQGFPYSSEGEQLEASFIEITAPSAKHSKECAILKQAFFRSLPDASPDDVLDTDDANPEISGPEVMTLLAMSPNVELSDVLDTGKRLLSGGVARVDGRAKLSMNLLETMHQDDFEMLLGDYIANFIVASSLARMKMPSGKTSSTSSSSSKGASNFPI